jgi:hypothetical protein
MHLSEVGYSDKWMLTLSITHCRDSVTTFVSRADTLRPPPALVGVAMTAGTIGNNLGRKTAQMIPALR